MALTKEKLDYLANAAKSGQSLVSVKTKPSALQETGQKVGLETLARQIK